MKRFLQRRHVSMPMCHNRMLGFHVVRSTVPTLYLWPQFTVANKFRIERNPEHKQRAASYLDPQYYCNQMQYYFFRHTCALRSSARRPRMGPGRRSRPTRAARAPAPSGARRG